MIDTITVRQMPFEFPDEIDPVFIEGDPELSFEGMSTGYAMIAGSLLLPHLEPHLYSAVSAREYRASGRPDPRPATSNTVSL